MCSARSISKTATAYFPSLTGLRFYTALLVFISHLYLLNYLVGLPEQSVAYDFINKLGQLGVSLFFVLSGFILSVNYPVSRKLNLKAFYTARLARIYPVFLLTNLIALPIELFSTTHHHHIILSLLMHLGLIHCFQLSTCGTLNSPGWSISSEFVFYVLFPILTLLFFRRAVLNISIAFLVFLGILIPLKLLLGDNFYVSHTFPLARLADFMLGMFVGWCFLNYQSHPRIAQWMASPKAQVLMTGIIIGSFLLMVSEPLLIAQFSALKSYYFLFYALPAAIIILGMALRDRYTASFSLLTNPWVILGGEVSYSFYLVHHLLMRYSIHLYSFIFHLSVKQAPVWHLVVLACTVLVSSLLSAYWLYHRVEIPCKRQIMLWLPNFLTTLLEKAQVEGKGIKAIAD